MPPALTPKVALTVLANQGTQEMATTVQVGAGACKVSSLLKKKSGKTCFQGSFAS